MIDDNNVRKFEHLGFDDPTKIERAFNMRKWV
jgi:hypothetical protein